MSSNHTFSQYHGGPDDTYRADGHAFKRTDYSEVSLHEQSRSRFHIDRNAGGPAAQSSKQPTPPREPRAMREQQRTPRTPHSPSPDYIAISRRSSARLEDPTASRKLLVLDLNGTLLYRSANVSRPKHRPPQMPSRSARDGGGWLPRLRPVYPRPYMPAFRTYLFAPQTKAWLDVMVWSSAQPHSVSDMVKRCFQEEKKHLVAVWARDTLGLSEGDYHLKVPTVKDLSKPWTLLPGRSSSPHDSVASTPPSSPPRPSDSHIGAEDGLTPQAHSALTTLLLDDSPHKAELQPYNHVCVGEYSGALRMKDLQSFQQESEWRVAQHALEQRLAEAPTESAEESALAADSGAEAVPGMKKRKRKEERVRKRAAFLESLGGQELQVAYDETLLAVVGVLHTIKHESNVAAWIRAGGLWGPAGAPDHIQPVASGSKAPAQSEDTQRASPGGSDLSIEKDATQPTKTKKRKKKRKPDAAAGEHGVEHLTSVGNDAVSLVSDATALKNGECEDASESQPLWFEDAPTFAYWTARGREALEEFEIPIEHGIEQ